MKKKSCKGKKRDCRIWPIVSQATKHRNHISFPPKTMTENISHQIFPTKNPSATESQNSETLGRWQLPIMYFMSISNHRVGKRKLNSLLHYFLQQIHFLRTQIDRRLPGRRRLACPVRLVLAAVFSAELGPSPSEGRLITVPSIDGGGIRSLVSSNIIAKA